MKDSQLVDALQVVDCKYIKESNERFSTCYTRLIAEL